MTSAIALLMLILVLLAGTAPSLFGYESFVVYSGSMEPAIHVGDLAVVGPTKPDALKVGDVITYRTPDRPGVVVTHRLMDIAADDQGRLKFTTKGDANNSSDQLAVESGAVLGRVAFDLPMVGYLVDFSKQPVGKVLLLGIPALLLALDYLKSLRRKESGEVVAPRGEAGDLVARARVALRNNSQQAAAALLDRAVSLDPHLDEAWLLKAECLADQRERLSCLRTGLTINPSSSRLKKAVEFALAAEVAVG